MTDWDFATCLLHTFMMPFVLVEGQATFASIWKWQVSLYKYWNLHFFLQRNEHVKCNTLIGALFTLHPYIKHPGVINKPRMQLYKSTLLYFCPTQSLLSLRNYIQRHYCTLYLFAYLQAVQIPGSYSTYSSAAHTHTHTHILYTLAYTLWAHNSYTWFPKLPTAYNVNLDTILIYRYTGIP